MSLASTPSIVLAGGLGTRLRSVVSDVPKPMATVDDQPFLVRVLSQIRDAGGRRAILCVGHLADAIESYFGDGSSIGLDLEYSCEASPLGTAGAIALAARRLESDPFLAFNGDSYCPIDLAALLDSHASRRAIATIAVSRVEDADRYGVVRFGADEQVEDFLEKGSAAAGYVNAGVYALDRRALADVPPDAARSIERDVFPSLIGRGLFAFPTEASFLDIGTPESYAAASATLRRLDGGD